MNAVATACYIASHAVCVRWLILICLKMPSRQFGRTESTSDACYTASVLAKRRVPSEIWAFKSWVPSPDQSVWTDSRGWKCLQQLKKMGSIKEWCDVQNYVRCILVMTRHLKHETVKERRIEGMKRRTKRKFHTEPESSVGDANRTSGSLWCFSPSRQ
jgi:hypothetical protein